MTDDREPRPAAPWRFYSPGRTARILGVTKDALGPLSEPSSGVEWVLTKGRTGATVRLYRADTIDALAARIRAVTDAAGA